MRSPDSVATMVQPGQFYDARTRSRWGRSNCWTARPDTAPMRELTLILKPVKSRPPKSMECTTALTIHIAIMQTYANYHDSWHLMTKNEPYKHCELPPDQNRPFGPSAHLLHKNSPMILTYSFVFYHLFTSFLHLFSFFHSFFLNIFSIFFSSFRYFDLSVFPLGNAAAPSRAAQELLRQSPVDLGWIEALKCLGMGNEKRILEARNVQNWRSEIRSKSGRNPVDMVFCIFQKKESCLPKCPFFTNNVITSS